VTRLTAVADDLTGANGLGGRWAGRGAAVCVARRVDWLRTEAGCRILDAETRMLGPGPARTKVQAAWTALGGAGLLFQKIDSTLRGNPAAEIEGLMLATTAPWVAVLPAYPALGRQVLGSAVWVHGKRLDRTEYFRDPLSPAKVWRPRDLFPAALVAHAPLKAVAGGAVSLGTWLRRALASRPRFVTFDCAEEAQIQVIADACLANGCRHFAGAADLGGALAARILGPAKAAQRPRGLPWMVLAGSVSATTFEQLQAWREAGGHWEARLSRPALGRWRTVPARLSPVLRKRLMKDGSLALSGLAGREDLAPWCLTQTRRGRSVAHSAEDAMAALARWGLSVSGGLGPCGYFVTGGHTLRALDDAAGFRRFHIVGEVLPEVPLGRAEGPQGWAWLCSKPGGFGPRDCFVRFMEAGA
jgi:D-threonate/D-erythronate kinase